MASAEVALIARRRRFNLEQKRQLLDEAERTSMAAVARRHGIARSVMQRWKDLLARDAGAFVRVVPSATTSATPSRDGATIFVHVDATIIIEMPASVAPAELAAFVFALRR